MSTFVQTSARRGSRFRGLAVLTIVMIAAQLPNPVQGQESFYGSSTTGIESVSSWPWWHSLYYKSDGSMRYGRGFANSTRYHSYRLPINPPICGPSFGYYQPCWRQLPLVRRCVTCETMAPDREIPTAPMATSAPAPTPSVSPIPPAPEASKDLEAGHSDPDTLEAPATEAPIP